MSIRGHQVFHIVLVRGLKVLSFDPQAPDLTGGRRDRGGKTLGAETPETWVFSWRKAPNHLTRRREAREEMPGLRELLGFA